ncbi:serine hydrolase domain-containing protein [Streptosporangium subroseum]|uniref:serine hydrolase domain-containing protein n=1 Tax=Streptosporangium subroseum TaxID=106412 RepID=UPI00308FCC29|nr:beta-lactamase family protein [Streptosporangium subroseum]
MSCLRSALEELAVGRGPGLFALVTEGGETVFTGGVGTADLADPRPIGSEDRFRVASVTKLYTATVVLQLAAEGRLPPASSVEHWLPGLLPDGDRITVEHLLRMRSGLADYVWAVLGDPPRVARLRRYFSPRDLVRTALAQLGREEPGRRWRYSNTDYILLGLIIEQVTGQPVQDVLRERIFQPLGLTATSMPISDLHLPDPHVRGYLRMDAETGYVDCTEYTPSEAWTSGAIVSTPPDVARFLDALLGGRLLSPAWLAAMRAVEPARMDLEYGMGLFRYHLPDGTALYGHGGVHFGVECYAFRSDTGRTVVLHQNSWDRVAGAIPRDNPFICAAFASNEFHEP